MNGLVIVAIFLLAAQGAVDCRDQKSIITALDAKWTQTSLLAESSEFLSKEGNGLFWSFIEKAAATPGLSSLTTKERYDSMLKWCAMLISGARMDLLKFSLSLRVHSPSVQMFRQIGNEADSESCDVFLDVHGQITCSLDNVDAIIKQADLEKRSDIFPSVDHVYPGSSGNKVRAVLYVDVESDALSSWHEKLVKRANQGHIEYLLRHHQTKDQNPVRLSGYGVELAIKSQEYKAQDDTKIKANVTSDGAVIEEEETQEDLNGFNFKRLKELHPDLKNDLTDFKMHLLEDEELAPLKVWQLQDLSFQAGQRVVSAGPKAALQTLTDISQNFPMLARSLAKVSVKADYRKEVERNQRDSFEEMGVSSGETALFVNGLLIDLDTLDIFQLLQTLKKEERLSAGFFKMGFRREYLSLLMNMDMSQDSSNYAIDVRNGFPEYINDLDKDKEYRQWGNSVKLMLQPYFPGMIRPIARNFFTLVFVVDPAAKETRGLLKIAFSFYAHDIPIRIGLIFVTNPDKSAANGMNDVGIALLNMFNFIKDDKKPAKALRAITEIFDKKREEDITPEDVHKHFTKSYSDVDVEDVFGDDSDYDKGRSGGRAFLDSSGLGDAPKVLLNGIPLDDDGLSADRFEETVITEIQKITPKIQKAIMDDSLTDDLKVGDWILDQPEVMPRLNARILGRKGASGVAEESNSKTVFLDLTDTMEYTADDLSQFKELTESKQNAYMIQHASYLFRSGSQYSYSISFLDVLGRPGGKIRPLANEMDLTRPVTLWIVADLNEPEGRLLVYNSIRQLKQSHNLRISIVHNPSSSDDDADAGNCKPKSIENDIAGLVQSAFKNLPMTIAKSLITKLVKEDNAKGLASGSKKLEDLEVNGMKMKDFQKRYGYTTAEPFLEIHSYFARHTLGLKPGERGVLVNGQLIGPLNPGEVFETEDVGLLEKYSMARGAQTVATQIEKWGVDKAEERASNTVMRVMALVLADPVQKRRHWVVLQDDTHSVVTLAAADDTTAAFDIVAVVDPLSREAQKLSPLLQVLSSVINADIKLVMNCKPKLSEMPLKSFYRYVVEPELLFTGDGSLKNGPNGRFNAIPLKTLLTLNLAPPEAWLVESTEAVYDLDNLKMENVDSDVMAKYELEHLLLEGHCFDEVTGNPPRGLQFVLGTPSNEAMVDTIVMANLGYFQLKANPGSWMLSLRDGNSKRIYSITTHSNTDSAFNKVPVRVLMDSFTGKIIRVKVAKNPGMENEKLLGDSGGTDEEEGGGGGIWQSISQTVKSYSGGFISLGGGGGGDSSSGGSSDSGAEEDTINIMSLASGHLYERFMRIMMLSVMKNTQHKVKFWLLKNYLSPSFKKFLPFMAEHYGFEFEYIQYKWPRWLHQQKEKQRLMWGYKILFLDVLFPLDVKKVIFVDADQVARTDMMELVRLPLDGAPYAYTPFCDSRTDMEGFRFWKQGYWAQHLGPRSALYVIDLAKFRAIAAGDRLRGQYQGLSADPNSLSNLDQDLPNNMIHQVKIKSLPQEWLWCETWCSESSKSSAKTIDLCNNPQTKEPKLESAMRIIGEWKDYDQEIKDLQAAYVSGGGQSTAASSTTPTSSSSDSMAGKKADDEL